MRYRSEAMVVAGQPEAAEAGIDILRAGGNAIDAAVSCALVQGVVDPMMCGIGGFGSCAIAMPATGFHGYVDFHAPAPIAVRPDMWNDRIEFETRDGFGFVLRDRSNELGYQAICTPVGLRGYIEAHREHGRLPWQQVVEPAIGWAEEGWIVRPGVESFWSAEEELGRVANHERVTCSHAGRALYCRADGTPKRAGDRVVNRDLAQTLRLIATGGDKVFYEGEIAHAIADDMARHGGLITLEDLHRCKATRSLPLTGTYGDYTVSTNRPPGGGVALLEMLNIIEDLAVRDLGHNSPEYIHLLAEAMKSATRDEDRFVGDPAFLSIPIHRLTSKAYARAIAAELRGGGRVAVERLGPPAGASEHTTHVSVVDAEGNCVAMTHSLGMPSGVITDGLGFMYNGCMSVFDPRPDQPGSLAPGKARVSSIAPSIVFRHDRPDIVIGAPGGAIIAMAILQVLINAIEFDMMMVEAVSAPRFSATSNAIDICNRIPLRVQQQLEREGYQVIRSPLSFDSACVYAIRLHPDGLDGGADPGGDGVVLTV